MTPERAQALLTRSEKAGKAFAVFLVNGRSFAASEGTEEYGRFMRTAAGGLVGIYDADATARQVVEDVEASQ